jgi:hypothetical protein
MWLGIREGACASFFLCRVHLIVSTRRIFTVLRLRGAMFIGVMFTSIVSWLAVTYFPHTTLGDSGFDFFKQVVAFHPTTNILDVRFIRNSLDVDVLLLRLISL